MENLPNDAANGTWYTGADMSDLTLTSRPNPHDGRRSFGITPSGAP